MRINHNIQSLNTYRQLSSNNESVSKSIEKLSSGLRINRAGDDAAGLAISEKMRSQIRGLDQGARNAQDGISMLQTAEGALNETHSILQRMRELAVQGSNSTLSGADRESIGDELKQLVEEIDRIATTTEFNGGKLLDGSLETQLDVTGAAYAAATTTDMSAIQIGRTITPTNGTFAIGAIDVKGAAANTNFALTSSGATLTLTNSSTNVAQSVTVADMAVGTGSQEFNFSTLGVRFSITGSVTTGASTGTNIASALVGLSTHATTKVHIKTETGNSAATFAIGANQGQTMQLSFGDMSSDMLGTSAGTTVGTHVNLFTLVKSPGASSVIDTTAKAQTLITEIDKSIVQVSSQRGKFGAAQNRLEYTIRNLQTASENLTASESRIRDVDMAKEIMEQAKTSILSQAATAMLAQSNQTPQSILQLLR